jgi:hypothetical protein
MKVSNQDREPVTLTIVPLTGADWVVPADVRLRRLLKAMLRVFGWRCVAIDGPPGKNESDTPKEITQS